MSVNAVQTTQSSQSKSQSISSAMLDQAKRGVIGAVAGAAIGKGVSVVAPVSHNKIAAEIVDHYVKTNKDGLYDLAQGAANLAAKSAENDVLKQMVEVVKKGTPEAFTSKKDALKEMLKQIGQQVPEGADITKDGFIKTVEDYLKDNAVTKDAVETAKNSVDEALKKAGDDALTLVKDFFKKPRKERLADDIVSFAKKAAKKAQSGKIIGTAILAGTFTMLFSDVISGIFAKKAPKGQAQTTPDAAVQSSQLNTHQG